MTYIELVALVFTPLLSSMTNKLVCNVLPFMLLWAMYTNKITDTAKTTVYMYLLLQAEQSPHIP